MGGRVAHEFVCLLEAGEDDEAICRDCGDAWNAEVADGSRCPSCGHEAEERRAVEIGNIFQLGTRYTDALGVRITGRDGARHRLFMGSCGIGISRLLATLVEQNHDEGGIALPAASVGRSAQRSGAVELRERRTGRVHRVDASDVPHFLTTLLSDLKRREEIAAS